MRHADISILRGGFFSHEQDWHDLTPGDPDYCRLWFPVSGSADIRIGTETLCIEQGNFYFIPVHQRTTRVRNRDLDITWMHIKADSLLLAFRLSQITRVHTWKAARMQQWRTAYKQVDAYFRDFSMVLELKLHAMALDFISKLLEEHSGVDADSEERVRQVERLLPAVSYMDQHFHHNPSLAEVAREACMSPIYFHQRFTSAFGTTPHRYIENKRMQQARRLLNNTRLPVAEIARQTGYENPFYFSRRFKCVARISPLQFRRAMQKSGP